MNTINNITATTTASMKTMMGTTITTRLVELLEPDKAEVIVEVADIRTVVADSVTGIKVVGEVVEVVIFLTSLVVVVVVVEFEVVVVVGGASVTA